MLPRDPTDDGRFRPWRVSQWVGLGGMIVFGGAALLLLCIVHGYRQIQAAADVAVKPPAALAIRKAALVPPPPERVRPVVLVPPAAPKPRPEPEPMPIIIINGANN